VNAFVTRKRFYAIVSLNTKKDEALEEKFLTSFELPERQAEPAKTTASNSPQNEQGLNDPNGQKPDANGRNRAPGQAEGGELNPSSPSEGNTDSGVAANVAGGQQQNQQKRGPIAGGMLNSKAIYLPTPEVPPGEASGVVLVAVVIDEQGNVIDARAVSGPQHLQPAAVNAARLARFSPTMLMGEPVRVTGTLSYNFVRSN
jgi:protein TonB